MNSHTTADGAHVPCKLWFDFTFIGGVHSFLIALRGGVLRAGWFRNWILNNHSQNSFSKTNRTETNERWRGRLHALVRRMNHGEK